jgi:hypothetical protein
MAMQAGSYLGHQQHEAIESMILGTDGLLYICGHTLSPDFPKTWQGFDQVFQNGEGFITAFESNLTMLAAGGFLGGNFDDYVYDLATFGSYIYFAGWTQSDTFWQTPAAFDTLSNGSTDAFVLRTGSLISGLEPSTPAPWAQVREHTLHVELEQAASVALQIHAADGRLVHRTGPVMIPGGPVTIALPELGVGAYLITLSVDDRPLGLKYFR